MNFTIRLQHFYNAGGDMNLTELLKSRQRSTVYIPLECQVHTCKQPSVAYCESAYTFVCARHVAEFCAPAAHRMLSIEDGLADVVKETESQIRSNDRTRIALQVELKKYNDHLAMLRKGKDSDK